MSFFNQDTGDISESVVRAIVASVQVEAPRLIRLKERIIAGYAKGALFIATTVNSQQWLDLVPLSTQLFSDRPLPVTLAAIGDAGLKHDFDDLAEHLRDEWPDASWDEANSAAYVMCASIPITRTFKHVYDETVRGHVPDSTLIAATDVMATLRDKCASAVRQRVDLVEVLVGAMNVDGDGVKQFDLTGVDVTPWTVTIVELVGVILLSNDLNTDLVVGHKLADPNELLAIYNSRPRQIDYNKFVFCWLMGHDARSKSDMKRATRKLGELMPTMITTFIKMGSLKR